ncbi:SRPBCC family protein [Streptomyces sp. HPF1205]|uniref:SRPBCC family protein n=1 Tax=Streptomyces sp. HPF1205 TaxID=2873262 RepID=UPI001CEC8EF2|nr:SRPBCC family protein [Streptomyces sp. HPF1205]
MTERTQAPADTNGGPTKGLAKGLTQELPTDRLLHEGQDLLAALGERALSGLSAKLGDATERLTGVAENGGSGLAAALKGGRDLAEGKSVTRSLLGAGFTQVKEKAKGMLPGTGDKGEGGGGADGGGKTLKATNIVESIDVGVPVSVAYNQWTEFEDFPTFMKKVENVKQQSDTELDWKAQVFWSHRTWKSNIVEQMPDERIVWESTGEKGRVDGTVTFHELTPDLTRILLVLVYHPQGFFERTGNIWRAQGRRARLELKHFRRHVMTETILHQDEVRGWRGEVADGEVVRSDEDVRAEEEGEEPGGAGEEPGEEDEEEQGAQAEEDEERDEDEEPDRDDENEDEDEYEEDDEYEDEAEDDEDDEGRARGR